MQLLVRLRGLAYPFSHCPSWSLITPPPSPPARPGFPRADPSELSFAHPTAITINLYSYWICFNWLQSPTSSLSFSSFSHWCGLGFWDQAWFSLFEISDLMDFLDQFFFSDLLSLSLSLVVRCFMLCSKTIRICFYRWWWWWLADGVGGREERD